MRCDAFLMGLHPFLVCIIPLSVQYLQTVKGKRAAISPEVCVGCKDEAKGSQCEENPCCRRKARSLVVGIVLIQVKKI